MISGDKNEYFTSTDSAGGGRSIFTPRGISDPASSSPHCSNKRHKFETCCSPTAILFLTYRACDILHRYRHAHEVFWKSKMADAGGVQEENVEMVETQRKMSEPPQPTDSHNAQAQKSEVSKKSLKKKGESEYCSWKQLRVYHMVFIIATLSLF